MDISNMRVKFTPGDPELSVGRDERSPIDFHLRGSRHGSFDASPSEKDPNVHNEPVARVNTVSRLFPIQNMYLAK